MRIAAIGYDAKTLESLETEDLTIEHFLATTLINSLESYDAFFLNEVELLTPDLLDFGKTVLINSVIYPIDLVEKNTLCFRVNHWPSFVEKNEWEIVGKPSAALDELLGAMKKNHLFVKNEVGLIAPRILAMIINEAHFAIEEKVSSSDEIDIAMKLGTGYPLGPLEWGKAIGLRRIYDLLLELSKTNERYLPNKLLTELALKK